MSKSAVIYWSGTGNTEAMAQAVLDGLNGAGEDAALFSAAVSYTHLDVYKRQQQNRAHSIPQDYTAPARQEAPVSRGRPRDIGY